MAFAIGNSERTPTKAALPSRKGTSWFHDYVVGKAEIRHLRGRLRFKGSKINAPFDSMIVIYPKKRVRVLRK